MTMLASQITSLPVVCSIVYSDVNQRKHQSSASLAFVREIHRGPVNFPHKWPVTRKMFPFDDVIMLRRHVISKHVTSSLQRSQQENISTTCTMSASRNDIKCKSNYMIHKIILYSPSPHDFSTYQLQWFRAIYGNTHVPQWIGWSLSISMACHLFCH